MAQQNIDFGTFPDDPSADAIRTAFQKVQQNFTEVYSGLTSTAVRSVNRTAGAGITVNSPTGNVVVTANIASVSISSVTLKVGTSPNPVTNNATYTSYSQTLYIEIPDNLSVANISASGNITANGNLIASNANLGNAVTANYFTGDGTNLTNVTSATSNTANTAGTVTQNAQPNITSLGILSSLEVSGSITPTTDVTYDLGNATHAFRDLYLSGSSIKLGNSIISANASGVIITNPGNKVVAMNPGGTNTQVQFNDSNTFGGNAGMTFNKSTTTLTANNIVATSTANLGAVGNVTITGGSANYVLLTNGSGVLSWGEVGNANYAINANYATNANSANFAGNATNANYATNANSANFAGVVIDAAQPNITSVGTLASLSVSGNANVGNFGTAGLITASGTITGGNLATAGTLSVGGNTTFGNLSVSGNLIAGNIQVDSIVNGTSNVDITNTNGNVTVGVDGTPNVLTVTSTGANIAGTLSASGNINAGNVTATTFTGALSGAATSATTAGTVTTAAQPNITSTGTLASLSVSGNSNLGAVGNVHITGSAGFLQNDGTGNLSFTSPITQSIPGAANSLLYSTGSNSVTASGNIKFNDPSLDITGNLSVTGNANVGNIGATNIVGTLSTGAQPSITAVGTLSSLALGGILGSNSNITLNNANAHISTLGNMTANVYFGNGSQLTGITSSTAATVTANAQPNITSVGTLTGLSVSGNVGFSGPNVTLGAVANLHITGGSANYVLTTDGSGNLSWSNVAGSGVPAGSNTQVQFNNAGNFGATAGFTFDSATGWLRNSGNITANSEIHFGDDQGSNAVNDAWGRIRMFGNASPSYGFTYQDTGNIPTPHLAITNEQSTWNQALIIADGLQGANGTALGFSILNQAPNSTPTTGLEPGWSPLMDLDYYGNFTLSGTSNLSNVPIANTGTANVGGLISRGISNLNSVSNVIITGGSANFVLTTNGSGNLTWANVANGGIGNIAAGGTNNQVQYNDNGILGGNPGMIFEEGITRLTANNFVATSTANLGNVGNVTITGGSNGQAIITDGNGNLSWGNAGGGGGGNVAGSNTQVQFNDSGVMGANANLTFNKTSGNLTVGSNVVAVNFIGSGANTPTIISGTNLDLIANAAVRVPSNLTLTGTNVSLGAVGNLHITGGSNGQALVTDGSGNLSWADAGTGGGTNLIVKDESNVLTNTANTLNFTGNGVVATAVGNVVTIDIAHNGPDGNIYEVQVNDGNGNFYADYGLRYDYTHNNVEINATVFINPGVGANKTSDLNIGEVNFDYGSNTYAYKENARLRYIDDSGSSFYGFTANTSEDFLFITMEPGTEASGVAAIVLSQGQSLSQLTGSSNTIFGISVNDDLGANVNESTGLESNYVPLFNLTGKDLYIPQLTQANANNILGFNSSTGRITYTVPTVIVQDEGSNVLTLANTINFVGNGVIASNVGGVATITISGGSSNATVAGSNTQVQFNDAGSFGAVSSFTYNKSTNTLTTNNFVATTSANLGNVGNITITGGNNGFFLQTDGAGNLTWAAGGNSTGNGTPGGANTQIQFNDGGNFGGTTGFTFNKTTTVFTANNIVATSTANLGNVGNVRITGGDSGQVLTTDGTGNLIWANAVPNQGGYYLHTQSSASNVWTVTHNLNRQYVVIEPIDSNGNSYTGRYDFPSISFINANALTMTWSSSLSGYAAVVGGTGNTSGISGVAIKDEGSNVLASANTINFVGNGVVASNVGGVATITIQGIGSNNTVAGSDTQVQFNDGGIFGASAGLTYNKANTKLTSNNFIVTTTANLGNAGNVTITGGGANFVLITDGSGNLSWANIANGGAGNIGAAGANTQVQYNDNGILGGNPAFIFNEGTTLVTANNLTVSSISRFGNVGNVHIDGGSSNFVLKTDGSGNLSWANIANGDIGNIKAAGSNTQIQFNDDGTFGAIAGFTFNKSTTVFTANNVVATSTANLGDVGNVYVGGGNALDVLVTIDGAGNLAWGTIITDGAGGANTQVQYNDDGILGGNPAFTFNESTTLVTANNFVATSTANLGAVGNVTITGGSANYVLQTDGAGNLSWTAQSGGGSGNITIQDEGSNVVASANVINFVGSGVVASNVGGVATITIDNGANSYYGGYYLHTQASASNVWTVTHNLNRQYVTVEPVDSTGNSYTGRYDFPTINYINANALTMTWSSNLSGFAAIVGGGTTVEGVNVQDEGSNVIATASTINFVGAGVTASNVGGVATVNIPGAGAGSIPPYVRTYTGNATATVLYYEWLPLEFDATALNNTIGATDYDSTRILLPAGTYMYELTVPAHSTGSDSSLYTYTAIIANPLSGSTSIISPAGFQVVGDWQTSTIQAIGKFTIASSTYISAAIQTTDGYPTINVVAQEGYCNTILKIWPA